jgi:hypothetical protein
LINLISDKLVNSLTHGRLKNRLSQKKGNPAFLAGGYS